MTGTGVTEQQVREILLEVKHPAIDLSLLELGIVKSFTVEDGRVKVLMAFPFANIPVKDILEGSVKRALDESGIEVEIDNTVMGEEELKNFLALEQANWKGL